MAKQKFSLEDIGGMFKEGFTRAVSRPTIFGYVPHDKQISFHSAPTKGRLYIGGNRSGKTVGGIVEDIWRLRGNHPYLNVPSPPVRGRIVTVSYTEGIELIIKPELAKWLPPSDLINGSWEDSYSPSKRMLTLANGSTVELMSYDQKLEKFAGTSRHFIHFDEEPPKSIFNECTARLIDTAGPWYITMTPVEGMTWVYDDVYTVGLNAGSNITVIVVSMEENPYISNAEIESYLSNLDKDERRARGAGEFVQIGGLVYKSFVRKDHVINAVIPPLEWTHYASMDHGLNAPTCWLWHAVAPSGAVVTYDELYANETLVHQFAEIIHERNNMPGRRAPDVYVGDPAIAQRNAQTGDSIQTAYAIAGIPIALGNKEPKIAIDKMNKYLSLGKWVMTNNCPMLATQLERVKWKIFDSAKRRHDNNPREEIHKLNDHAPDSARYLFGLMPDLQLPKDEVDRNNVINRLIKDVVNPSTPPVGPMRDTGMLLPSNTNNEWTVIDEHMGGIW